MRRSYLLALILALASPFGAHATDTPLHWRGQPANLLEALREVSAQSGLRIIHPEGSALLESLPAPPLAPGRHRLPDLLDALLEGSGLGWHIDAEGDLVIEPRPRLEARTVLITDTALEDETPIRPGASAAGMPGTTPWRADELGDWPTLDWQQLLRYAPNVAGQGANLNLRGVGLGRGAATAASVYLDGMPLPLSVIDADAVPLHGLDGIEFRRGPRSPWEGASTLGGSIDLRTRTPAPERALGGGATIGSGHDWRGWLEADSGIGTRGLGSRLTVERRHSAGFHDHAVRDEQALDRQQITSALLKLSYEPDHIEALTVGARLLGIAGDPGQPLIAPASPAQTDFDPFRRESFDPFTYRQRLRSAGGAVDVDWRGHERLQAWMHLAYGHGNERAELSLAALPSERQRSFERESRGLISTGAAWVPQAGWRLSLGGEVERRRFDSAEASLSDIRDFFPPALDVRVEPQTDRVIEGRVITRTTSRSLSLDVRRDIGRWTLDAGMRLLDERLAQGQLLRSFLTQDACTIAFGTVQIPCDEEFPARSLREDSGSRSTVRLPHARVEYRPGDSHRVVFGYRRGYLSGGTQFNLISGDFEVYAPERSATWDLAWHWERESLKSALTLFGNRWRDRQIPIALPQAGSFLIGNAGRATAKGAEWVVRGAWSDSIRWHLGLGYLSTRFDSFTLAQGFDVVDLAGKRFPEAPKCSAVAGLSWKSAHGLHAGIGGRYSSGVFSDPANRAVGYRGGHVALDTVAGWRGERHHLFLAVDNLTDRRYLRGLQLVAGQPNPRFYRPAAPRTLRLGLQIDW
jgi:iron complex outermembrane recepter protein